LKRRRRRRPHPQPRPPPRAINKRPPQPSFCTPTLLPHLTTPPRAAPPLNLSRSRPIASRSSAAPPQKPPTIASSSSPPSTTVRRAVLDNVERRRHPASPELR
jgi:hypothetical protein